MEAAASIPFPGGVAHVLDLASVKKHSAWPQALQRKAKDHRFYEIVEETLDSGFEHHYLALDDEHGTTRGIQPVFFVRQNLVEGIPALRRAVEAIRKRFPRFLTMRLLMVGCAAGEGHLGACRVEDERWMAEALPVVLRKFARAGRASLVVFKDFRAGYRAALEPLTRNGFMRVPSMPMTRLSLGQRDFDEYLAGLSKAARKDLRRKFRKAEGAPPLQLEVVSDVSRVVDEIYPLYLNVHARSKLKFETLTKEYFRELGRRLPERVRFFLWQQNERIVAFSLCLVHDGVIYDDYLGLDYRVALDLHLYFLSFRDIISWSIAERLDGYLSSPLSYEPKLHLGCELAPLDLYVLHTSRALNPVFGRLVRLLEPTRHDKVLHKFPNAHELHQG